MKLRVILLTALMVLTCFSLSYAEEKITLSTFYPAPYGDYGELTVNKMVVGPTYAIPTDPTDLVVEGSVGIGTEAPDQILEISQTNDPTAGTTYLKITNPSSGNWSLGEAATGIQFEKQGCITGYIESAHFRSSSTSDHSNEDAGLAFGTRHDHALDPTTKMIINNYGQVGIGTTAPGEQLEVNGNIRTTPDRILPNIVLDSTGAGDNWAAQGAYISIGESGALGSAALHMTYRGDGYGWIGSGAVVNAIPAFAYWRFDYNSKNIYTDSNVNITGTLTKGGGAFLIDHPLDSKNKLLRHSFVESPDMKNIYDGIVFLDEKGEAVITLPSYFEALNKDFRYLVTAIGVAQPNLHVKKEIEDNKFELGGGKAAAKVSWQVTGIRHDAFAEVNPIIVEEEKGVGNEFSKGEYIYPEVFKQKQEQAGE